MSDESDAPERDRRGTSTSAFGAGRRESHDASSFYERFPTPELSDDDTVAGPPPLEYPAVFCGDARDMAALPDASVALVVTSPPYFVGKEYELGVTGGPDQPDEGLGVPESYIEFLDMLRDVFAECRRVLEPGGRIAVNVANLGRKPYRSLSADVIAILQDDLHLLLRGEVIWQKGEGATGSVAWGSFRRATNPVLRDLTERVIIASKGRFDRARPPDERRKAGLPHESSLTSDEFMEATLDLWRIDAESARRVNHPAPFPVDLPRRLIDLYTYRGDVVLDPFVGSGSTLVAAHREGRLGVGYDLDPEYVKIASERLAREQEEGGGTTIEAHGRTQTRATAEGKKAFDLAEGVLAEAGFEIVATKPKLGRTGVQFGFLVADQPGTHQYYVDIAGAFTSVRPGLVRSDTLWKTLGRAHVLASLESAFRLLVLTPHLPKPGSDGDLALRSVGPTSVFDVVEVFDRAGVDRLVTYARASADQPLPGFWTDADLETRWPPVGDGGG